MNEAKTSEGLTLPEINTHYQDSGHAPNFHFSYERPMPWMTAAGKGERGRNWSEYAVRKQGYGQLLAEWLAALFKKLKLLIALRSAPTVLPICLVEQLKCLCKIFTTFAAKFHTHTHTYVVLQALSLSLCH